MEQAEMKIGIAGDTHGNKQAMRRLLSLAPPVELWLHTGDHFADTRFFAEETGVKVIGVRGNCDFPGDGGLVDEFIRLEGFSVWLTHGHKYLRYGGVADMGYWAKELGMDIAVYGHTHIPVTTCYGAALLINPGSPARPRAGSKPSFAVLTLREGRKPEVEFVNL